MVYIYILIIEYLYLLIHFYALIIYYYVYCVINSELYFFCINSVSNL